MNRTLPLESFWKNRGAKFGSHNDVEFLESFHSLDTEYQNYLAGSVLTDLSHRDKLIVTGKDHIEFLNNLLTHDVLSLKPGRGLRAMFLKPTAKILADMNVYRFQDSILLDLEVGLAPKVMSLFDRFLITEDVQFQDVSENSIHLAVTGDALNFFKSFFPKISIKELAPYEHLEMSSEKGNEILFRWDYPTAHTYHLLFPSSTVLSNLESVLEQAEIKGLKFIGNTVVETIRIENGILYYGKDITEEVSLPETGLDETSASDTKGCYPGQEVVARTRTYKGLQRKAVSIFCDRADLELGCKLYNKEGKEIGWVTSATYSFKYQKFLGLGYAIKGYFDLVTQIFIDPDLTIPATIVPLEKLLIQK